jgi:hypothetical protein
MTDKDIIAEIENKFDKNDEFTSAVKWAKFILIRKQIGQVERPIPQLVRDWLKKAIDERADQMVRYEGVDPSEAPTKAEYELTYSARFTGFRL